MRILICASAAPAPPMDGFRLLLDALLRELRRRHDVRVVAFAHPDQDPGAAADPRMRVVPTPPRGGTASLLALPRATLRGRPLAADRVARRLLPPVVDELRRFAPEVVHVTSGRLAALGRHLPPDVPTLLGAIDARHLNVDARVEAATGIRQALLREEAGRVRRFIATEYPRFGHVTVVTAEDRDALLEVAPGLPVSVIPNGVDVDHYRPVADVPVDRSRIVFTGVMSYAPNVTAAQHLARRVLPLVRRTRPDATLVLAGRAPVPEVRRLEELPGVTVTGEVPDLRPWLVASRVFAAPMRTGTGIKNKLLEAMACALPCVASPLASQGIHGADGAELLLAEGAPNTAAAIVCLLDDDALARRLGANARTHVEAHHSWAAVGRAHEHLYEQLRAARDTVDDIA